MMSSASFASWRAAAEIPDYEDCLPDWKEIRRSTHTAAKAHVCMICRKHIERGQRYEQTVGVEDGKFIIFRVHCAREHCM